MRYLYIRYARTRNDGYKSSKFRFKEETGKNWLTNISSE